MNIEKCQSWYLRIQPGAEGFSGKKKDSLGLKCIYFAFFVMEQNQLWSLTLLQGGYKRIAPYSTRIRELFEF